MTHGPQTPSLTKRWKRTMKRATLGWREQLVGRLPRWAVRAFGPAAKWADMLLLDHGVFRVVYLNRHRLSADTWRSAQPTPHQIGRMARAGVKTIVNLRGPRTCGSYWLEQEACRRHGITLVDYQLRSRAAPSRAEVLGARDVLERIEYPMLFHCKSGADRAGLMGVLYRHVRLGEPIATAKRELSWRYGHIRQSDTGVLDAFFDRYLADTADRPMPFFDWVEQVYDPDEVKATFVAKGWANRLVNDLLRRE
jgi:protein tyrosine phosphatase (PTP) superfamily phosphohydrolase (DUF442 family)